MSKPSTENLQALPNPKDLQNLCKSLSALEAIFNPEWQDRYYSYQKNWAPFEECCTMRNGSGNHMLILFKNDGACINGFTQESQLNSKQHQNKIRFKEILTNLPLEFQDFIYGEPVPSIGTTFCIWQSSKDQEWQTEISDLPDDDYRDGSLDILELLDGYPSTFKRWAEEEYYVEQFEDAELKLEWVEAIYQQEILTRKFALQTNPTLSDFGKLKSDLDEIGYPHEF